MNDDIKYRNEPNILSYFLKRGKTEIEAREYIRVRMEQSEAVRVAVNDPYDTIHETEVV